MKLSPSYRPFPDTRPRSSQIIYSSHLAVGRRAVLSACSPHLLKAPSNPHAISPSSEEEQSPRKTSIRRLAPIENSAFRAARKSLDAVGSANHRREPVARFTVERMGYERQAFGKHPGLRCADQRQSRPNGSIQNRHQFDQLRIGYLSHRLVRRRRRPPRRDGSPNEPPGSAESERHLGDEHRGRQQLARVGIVGCAGQRRVGRLLGEARAR